MKKLLILLCLACLFSCCSDDSTTGLTITGRWAMNTYVQRDDFMAFEMNPGQVTWTFTGNKLKVVNNFNYNNYRVWPPTGLYDVHVGQNSIAIDFYGGTEYFTYVFLENGQLGLWQDDKVANPLEITFWDN